MSLAYAGRMEVAPPNRTAFVAYLLGPVFSVVSGGIGTILVVAAVALIWPEIRKYGRLDS